MLSKVNYRQVRNVNIIRIYTLVLTTWPSAHEKWIAEPKSNTHPSAFRIPIEPSKVTQMKYQNKPHANLLAPPVQAQDRLCMSGTATQQPGITWDPASTSSLIQQQPPPHSTYQLSHKYLAEAPPPPNTKKKQLN